MPSSGDEGDLLSAEGPPSPELEPGLREAEDVVTPESQEPLVSSGEEQVPLIVMEEQALSDTPRPASGGPTPASWPTKAEEAWLDSVASSSSSSSGSVASTPTDGAPVSPPPRRRGRFKGLNGRHFQQQELEPEASAQQPLIPEAAGSPVGPPVATAATDRLGLGWNQSPWGELTNELGVSDAGEWGSRGQPGNMWGPFQDGQGLEDYTQAGMNCWEATVMTLWVSLQISMVALHGPQPGPLPVSQVPAGLLP